MSINKRTFNLYKHIFKYNFCYYVKVKINSHISDFIIFYKLNVGNKVKVHAVKDFSYGICDGVTYVVNGGTTLTSQHKIADYFHSMNVFIRDIDYTVVDNHIMQFNEAYTMIQEIGNKARKVVLQKFTTYQWSDLYSYE